MKKRLLIICQAIDDRHQALGFFADWVKSFAAGFESVTVVAQQVGPHDEMPANVRILSLGKERGAGRWSQLRTLWKLLLGERGSYDAVLVHMCPEYVLAAAPCCLALRKPIALWYAHKATPPALKIAMPFVASVLTTSKEGFRLPTPKLRILSQGIPESRIRPRTPPSGTLRLLDVSRLSPSKRHETVIEACARLEMPWTLTIAGAAASEADREYAESLKVRARELGVEGRVRFLGAVGYDGVWGLYADHDVFLHASLTGSMDKVVLEAIAAGMPVLTSSEAFAWLPSEMRYGAPEVESLASGIRAWARKGTDAAIVRETAARVRAEHGLASLSEKVRLEIERLL